VGEKEKEEEKINVRKFAKSADGGFVGKVLFFFLLSQCFSRSRYLLRVGDNISYILSRNGEKFFMTQTHNYRNCPSLERDTTIN
jgi:hypothetical protein